MPNAWPAATPRARAVRATGSLVVLDTRDSRSRLPAVGVRKTLLASTAVHARLSGLTATILFQSGFLHSRVAMELSLPDFDYERGQVGIETLVVFIAMVLVAAIAATVLINTTGFLQNKASATSHDSANQVSNQVNVISATGEVSGTNTINEVNLTVMQSPGADAIDLSGASVKWTGPDGAKTLTYAGDNESASATNAEFGVSKIKDNDSSIPVLNSRTDRMKINIALDQSGTTALKPLAPGEESTIQIVTQSGSQYTYVASVPQTLSSQDEGGAVSL
nr:archaellin/type IV pilin N-terminal domain-containing protein [Halarchaeum acidiphilum]